MTREEAIKRLKEARFTVQPYLYMNEAFDVAIESLSHERPKGRWVDEGEYVTTAYGSLDVKRCSHCDREITIDDFDSYCPNCGAEMER